jgi:hypothetical protein
LPVPVTVYHTPGAVTDVPHVGVLGSRLWPVVDPTTVVEAPAGTLTNVASAHSSFPLVPAMATPANSPVSTMMSSSVVRFILLSSPAMTSLRPSPGITSREKPKFKRAAWSPQ